MLNIAFCWRDLISYLFLYVNLGGDVPEEEDVKQEEMVPLTQAEEVQHAELQQTGMRFSLYTCIILGWNIKKKYKKKKEKKKEEKRELKKGKKRKKRREKKKKKRTEKE